MSRYSGYSICKETRTSVKHSHQVLYSLTSRLSTNHKSINQASVLQRILQSRPNIYSSLFIHPQTHVPYQLNTLTSIATTIPILPLPYINQTGFATTIKYLFEKFEKNQFKTRCKVQLEKQLKYDAKFERWLNT